MSHFQKEPDAHTLWLGSLAAGDDVVIYNTTRIAEDRRRLAQVTLITETQVVTTHGRFRKVGGVQVGKTFSPKLEQPTPAALEQLQIGHNRERFARLARSPEQITDGQISAMLAALDAAKPVQMAPGT